MPRTPRARHETGLTTIRVSDRGTFRWRWLWIDGNFRHAAQSAETFRSQTAAAVAGKEAVASIQSHGTPATADRNIVSRLRGALRNVRILEGTDGQATRDELVSLLEELSIDQSGLASHRIDRKVDAQAKPAKEKA